MSDSSAAGIVEDPSLAVMRRDIQDPRLSDIYQDLPNLK